MSTKKQALTVLVTGSFMQLFLGILYVWSVFVRPVCEVYGWHIESVKLTSSFMLCFFVIGILTGGKLILKIGSDKVVLGGGLLLAIGMLSTALLPLNAAWLMYITYGILGGFGVGAAYNAIISAVQKWYPKKRGFATGIVVCAFGFSTVLFAPLIETLVKYYGLRNTFLILAAAYSIVTIILFRFIRLPDIASLAAAQPTSMQAGKTIKKNDYTITETIRTKEFYFITISLMAATASFFILMPSFIELAVERGVPAFGTIIVMMTGVANASGRLIVPLLSDKIGREKATLAVIFVTSIFTLALLFAHGFMFIVSVLIIAFCFGSLPGIYSVLTSDYFGLKNVGANYGAVMMGFAVSALTFPKLIGLIQSDTIKFITLSAMTAGGVILIVLLMISKKKRLINV
ncbi:MAG: MFS transporter [Treponema sp.]|jgi:OFA family oxalate/formate antiporter-like MFS transporter|nr:MFS transporter [Treponema sp.]